MSRTGHHSKATLSGTGSLPGAKRLGHELQAMQTNPPPLCSAGLKGDNLFEWTAIILGPPDSVYEGGSFSLNLKFPKFYPFEPPEVRFRTKIYHCNVDESGGICMDLLDSEWTPAMTVSTLLLSICSLLTDPNPNNPLRVDIAMLYKRNRGLHDTKARAATERYAIPK